MAACGSSYWQDITIKYEDGINITVNVDHPTYEKILHEDQEIINAIRSNYEATKTPDITRSISPTISPTISPSLSPTIRQSIIRQTTNPNMSQTTVPPAITQEESKKKGEMPEGAVRLLIKLHKQYSSKMNDKKMSKKNVWTLMAKEMQRFNGNYNYTWLQLKTKYNNILTPYKKCVKHNDKTGVSPKYCKFYDDLDDYLGNRPFVRPSIILSSSTSTACGQELHESDENVKNDQSDDGISADEELENNPPLSIQHTNPQKRKRLTKRCSEIVEVIERHEMKRQDDTDKILDLMKKQHDEFLELENKRLALEHSKMDIFNKLLEKF